MCVAWRGLKWSGLRMEINHRGSFTETIAALHGDRQDNQIRPPADQSIHCAPVLMGDRAAVIFAAPEEIARMIEARC
jgi:hypothetical protein